MSGIIMYEVIIDRMWRHVKEFPQFIQLPHLLTIAVMSLPKARATLETGCPHSFLLRARAMVLTGQRTLSDKTEARQ